MGRVAIIGNSGGGKSTFARKLGDKLKIPVHHIDLLQFKPGWAATPIEEFDAVHDAWLDEPYWIIDGFGHSEAVKRRFDLADTLIFVDFPLALHYWWATKRQVESLIAPRPDWPPPGCNAWQVTGLLYKTLWLVHTQVRIPMLAQVNSYKSQKRVEVIKRPRRMAELLSQATKTA